MGTPPDLYLGLISGTSADGVDAALLSIREGHHQSDDDPVTADATVRVEAALTHPFREEQRTAILALCTPGHQEIARLGELDRELGHVFAEAALSLLHAQGVKPGQVRAIGSHGQTVRHCPARDDPARHSFTLQIGDPHTIAERTGITTIADFRSRIDERVRSAALEDDMEPFF